MKIQYLLLTILILTFLTIGCTENKSDYQQGTAAPTTQATLSILDSKLTKEEYGGWLVTGTAQPSANLSYSEVNVKFYDASGAVLQSGMTNILDLKAGEKWSFKVYGPGSDSKVANYTIATNFN